MLANAKKEKPEDTLNMQCLLNVYVFADPSEQMFASSMILTNAKNKPEVLLKHRIFLLRNVRIAFYESSGCKYLFMTFFCKKILQNNKNMQDGDK